MALFQKLLMFFWLNAVARGNITGDILIGGGSLSALAATITAVNVSKQLGLPFKIILLEPTDWPGGQLTSSNVPPDFGTANSVPENLPASFVDLLLAIAGPTWSVNPGNCWVSYKCFEANTAAVYIRDWLANHSDFVDVYYNTVIQSASRDTENGRIQKVVAIRRTAKEGSGIAGYNEPLSSSLADWYNAADSAVFEKEVLIFERFSVVIEATEWSDIMVTSGVSYIQGIEIPLESSRDTDFECGQSTVLPFYIGYGIEPAPVPDETPVGADGGVPFSMQGLTWEDIWSYRRAVGFGEPSAPGYSVIVETEQSNQNLDNDFATGYLFKSRTHIMEELDSQEGWRGGINTDVLRGIENRAYGWYHYLVEQQLNASIATHLQLNKTQVGTGHGLAKVPYLRDNRRLQEGLNG
jgi:hypothetical protein